MDIDEEDCKETLNKAESGLPQEWDFEILPSPDHPQEQWLKMLQTEVNKLMAVMNITVKKSLVIKPDVPEPVVDSISNNELSGKPKSLSPSSSFSTVIKFHNLLEQLKPRSRDYLFVRDRFIQFLRATTDLQLLNIAEEVGVSAWVVKKVLRRYDDPEQ